MTAVADTEAGIYYCMVCGPCLRLVGEHGDVTIHAPVEHPEDMTFDEDERPQ